MNKKIAAMFKEDQEERDPDKGTWDEKFWKELNKRDKKRRLEVRKIISAGGLNEAVDFYGAAMIFQHGETTSDYGMAKKLAKEAMEMGLEKAKWLYAATTDRYLVSKGKKQKFGTQFEKDNSDSWVIVGGIDSKTSQADRDKFNVLNPNEKAKDLKARYG